MSTPTIPVVDVARCIGAGQCEAAAPSTFEIGDDGHAVVVDPDGDDRADIEEAVGACPAQAITLDG